MLSASQKYRHPPRSCRGHFQEQEGDQRSPAGVFSINGACGYQPAIRKHPQLFDRQITSRNPWIEDPTRRGDRGLRIDD
jgi:hypothetical protein